MATIEVKGKEIFSIISVEVANVSEGEISTIILYFISTVPKSRPIDFY